MLSVKIKRMRQPARQIVPAEIKRSPRFLLLRLSQKLMILFMDLSHDREHLQPFFIRKSLGEYPFAELYCKQIQAVRNRIQLLAPRVYVSQNLG